ncbi:MAG: DNA alkylation repair protein [Anaerolineales bacterium]|nr:DNA alkylation repair protein [Anaerolineales bacterium]
MAPVDLHSLRRETLALSGLLGDPAAFAQRLRTLLEGHAHRLLRRGPSLSKRGALPAWDVPGLLVREVEAALLPAAQENPPAALAAAAALWPSGRLEEKQLAAFLAGFSQDSGEIRTLLRGWLEGVDDPVLLDTLAARACPPLWRSNAVLFRSDVRGWIEHPVPARRRFGWTALRKWAEEKTSESAFAAFDLLAAAFSESDPEAQDRASGLFLKLAEFYPQETQGWISELSTRSLERGRTFLRRLLPRLPAETAELIRRIRTAE